MAVTCLPSTPQRLRTCLFALHIIVSSRRHLHSPPMYRPPKTNNSRTSRVNCQNRKQMIGITTNQRQSAISLYLLTKEGKFRVRRLQKNYVQRPTERRSLSGRLMSTMSVATSAGGTDAERGLSFAGSVSPSPFIAVENFSSGPTRAWLASGAREGITAVSPEFRALDHDEPTRRGTNERTTLNERGQSSSSYEPRNKEEPSLLQ